MNLKWSKIGIVLFMAISVLMLLGCPQEATEETNDDPAAATSISVAGVAVSKVPKAAARSVWENESFTVTSMDTAYADLPANASLRNILVQVQLKQKSSTLMYARAAGGDKPNPNDFLADSEITVGDGDYVYIQVTTSDQQAQNYYRVQVRVKSADSTLVSITIGTHLIADIGTPAAVYSAAAAGWLNLESGTALDSVKVEVVRNNIHALVTYAKASGNAAPQFGTADTFTFVDGDILYVEVKSFDGSSTSVYKIQIGIGAVVRLNGITINGKIASQGTPNPDPNLAIAGTVLFSGPVTGAVNVLATPEATGAGVKYAKGSGSTVPSTFDGTTSFTFANDDYLYVQVTAENGRTLTYYKVRVYHQQTATVNYGAPEIKDSSAKFIDPLWNSVTEKYQIKRVYAGDSINAPPGFFANPDTYGEAKALWDEDGLYVYVEITDPELTDAPSQSSAGHEYDTLELFIKEGDPGEGSYGGSGAQHRLSWDNFSSGGSIRQSSAWATPTGYVLVFQAAWVAETQFPKQNGHQIGLEFQINACKKPGGNSSRYAVVCWNNSEKTNYMDATGFGLATLTGQPPGAQRPQITAQPASGHYKEGGTIEPLTVTAQSLDGGTLSYQWYTLNSATPPAPEAISSATGPSYTPSAAGLGASTYWVVVTNTNNNVEGKKTAEMTSSAVTVTISKAGVEQITAANGAFALYKFTLPQGETYGNYTKITAEYQLAAPGTARTRLMGNYLPADMAAATVSGNIRFLAFGSGAGDRNGPYINNNKGDVNLVTAYGAAADTWFTIELNLGENSHENYAPANNPAADAGGPFYFGVGLTMSGDGSSITYYVKNVTLSNADGSKKVVSTGAGLDLPAFVGNTTASLARTIEIDKE